MYTFKITQATSPSKKIDWPRIAGIIIGILATLAGSLLLIIFVGMSLSAVFGPKLQGTFYTTSCHAKSTGGRYASFTTMCYGTFTSDETVSVELKRGAGNEVAISSFPLEDVENKTFKAYAVESDKDAVGSSSQIVRGNGTQALTQNIFIEVFAILMVIFGIIMLKNNTTNNGSAVSLKAPESGTSAKVQRLREAQNRKKRF